MCLPGTIETVRARAEEEGIRAEEERAPRVDRRAILLGGLGAAVAAAVPGRAAAEAAAGARLQDLTHVFREGFPVFLGAENPTRETIVTIAQNGFYKQRWTFDEHSGTHMDAPGHFIEGGRRAPQIRLPELMNVPIVVIDISKRVAENPDAIVTPDDLRRFERRHGRIPNRALVCMYSGWESRVGNQDAFRNVGPDGKQHFPGFGKPAVDWLLSTRRITGIGVDTLSLDHGPSTTFDVHVTLLRANKYGLENLANLKKIPPRGATAFVGLIPWQEGSGGPCRVVARWHGMRRGAVGASLAG
jgi:kynurenine formamidase